MQRTNLFLDPEAYFARLLWEVRETAVIGNEEVYVQALHNVTAAGMATMLALDRHYNGQYLELKRPDIIDNRDAPEARYRQALADAAEAMRPGRALPWPCR